MFVASNDLIGGHGYHYFMFYYGSLRPPFSIILGP